MIMSPVQGELFEGSMARVRPSLIAEGNVRQHVNDSAVELASLASRAGVEYVQAVVQTLATGFWNEAVRIAGGAPAVFAPQAWLADDIGGDVAAKLRMLGADLASLPVEEAIAELGKVYTSLLQGAYRKKHGIFYTPRELTVRLVDDAQRAGMDWRRGKVISPACGGGAFLVEDARRMAVAMKGAEPAFVVASVGARLRGWDKDPFACWLSQMAVEAILLPEIVASGRRLAPIIECRDALLDDLRDHRGVYDLVNENPPFGKIKDAPKLRAKFARSLKGHPNAYGMFADVAVTLAKPAGGIVALLTPSSWLAGSYFGALRRTFAMEAQPVSIALVESRKDAFDDVLQEVSISCFVRGRSQNRAECSVIHVEPAGIRRELTGILVLPNDPAEPWSMPRQNEDASLIAGMQSFPTRLRDYGYRVSTGPLVWNRAAKSGRMHFDGGPGRVPVIWSEAVSPDGAFAGITPRKKNHAPFYAVKAGKDANVVSKACILVQRTTAKEQHRRLICALLPQAAIDQAGGSVAVENHLNMILPTSASPAVPMQTLAAFLATKTADQVLRCINASVAVSASELEALPLPAVNDLIAAMESEDPAAAVRCLYGMREGNDQGCRKKRAAQRSTSPAAANADVGGRGSRPA